jgi:hypothetical protein
MTRNASTPLRNAADRFVRTAVISLIDVAAMAHSACRSAYSQWSLKSDFNLRCEKHLIFVQTLSLFYYMGDSAYAYSLTTFAPSGKLVQIEHALRAVQAGATALGVKCVISTSLREESINQSIDQ